MQVPPLRALKSLPCGFTRLLSLRSLLSWTSEYLSLPLGEVCQNVEFCSWSILLSYCHVLEGLDPAEKSRLRNRLEELRHYFWN